MELLNTAINYNKLNRSKYAQWKETKAKKNIKA